LDVDAALQTIQTSTLPQGVKDNWIITQHYDLSGLAIAQKDYVAPKTHATEFRPGGGAQQESGWATTGARVGRQNCARSKNYANGIAELQQADLEDARNLHWLGLAYQGKGDAAEAQDFFARAAGFNSLPSIHYAFIRTKAKKMVQN
jgi:hypothetical protein